MTTINEQVSIDRGDAVSAVESALGDWGDADDGSWTDDEFSRARDHAREKFESDSWTRQREDPTA